jgi:hypothetical protein
MKQCMLNWEIAAPYVYQLTGQALRSPLSRNGTGAMTVILHPFDNI